MDRTDVCILINSTPSYYYILPFMFGMLRRYAGSELVWPIFLATEVPDHPVCKEIVTKYNVRLLELTHEDTGFLESRAIALKTLASEYKYCLPLQEDFILESAMDSGVIKKLLSAMDVNPSIVSARLMPCPGPKGLRVVDGLNAWNCGWAYLNSAIDDYGFTFQATMWSTKACSDWFSKIVSALNDSLPKDKFSQKERNNLEVKVNLAENAEGQKIFWMMSKINAYEHIAWVRKGPQPNAVYLSPFPYRPTAIVQGKLEEWAVDLAKREGFSR